MRTLRFSVFDLDQGSGELTRAGRRVAITPQTFVVLWTLADRAGRIVTRSELQRALWPAGTHVDFDRSLNFCVAAARRALGDEARRPRFIETIPTRGYRFIAEVRDVGREPYTDHVGRTFRSGVSPYVGRTVRSGAMLLAVAGVMALQTPSLLRAHTRATAVPQALAAFANADYADAARIDPRFAEAHYAVAAVEMKRAGADGRPAHEARRAARQAVDRALTLEDAPESLRLRASLRLSVDWDVEGAREDLTRALTLAPSWDLGLADLALVLSAAGDDEAAIETIARAEATCGACDLIAWHSALVHYRARQFDRALERLARTQRLAVDRHRPDTERTRHTHELALLIHLAREDFVSARREAVTLAALHGGALRLGRQPREAHDAVMHFLRASADRIRPHALDGRAPKSRLALLTALEGRSDEAVAWLEMAAAEREVDLPLVVRDPAFDALRGSPRFARLARDIVSGH